MSRIIGANILLVTLRPTLVMLCLSLLWFPGQNRHLHAVTKISPIFQVSPELKPRVDFWQNIFLRYGDNTFVIHDRDYPWIVIDYVFFAQIARSKNKPHLLNRKQQQLIMERYLKRLNRGLKRFAKNHTKALSHHKIERKIFTAYHTSPELLDRLITGQAVIRAQRGLADSFLYAARQAQDYLPYFEREFREVGTPIELTRLAFVESMFNPRAISKVGASGMWQFMRATAQHYLQVNKNIDERHSPFKAARAAAT
ncbi:MAG: transglycosylase SLT domain-containing protein, partial [Proteobacteria bacterium]|nr:transglycosylase SLT domain-containing protein [Pseudomonadota bacterium]